MQEHYVHAASIIHRFDARVKLIFTLAFIIFLNLMPFNAWPVYILYLSLILSAIIISRLNPGKIIKRSLLALPFILAAAPLAFTLAPVVRMEVWKGFSIPFSEAGFGRFLSIGIRSWISILAAIGLTATTPFPEIMAAFRQLKAPKLFVAIISLMWRYLFVISDEVTHMLRARASRSSTLPGLRSGGPVTWRARVTGGMAGNLFLRSLERSERVYTAMLSRGYNGDLPDVPPKAIRRADWIALTFTLLLLAGLLAAGVLL